MARRILRSSLLATAVLALVPVSAGASVTFGDSLGIPEGIIVPHPACPKACTLVTTISPEHLDWFRAPISGTIVRWRIQTVAGSDPQMLRLRVLEPVPGDELGPGPSEPFTAAGTSDGVSAPLGAGTFAFPARVPVKAGDFIGLDTEGALAAVAVEEESIRVFEPPPVDLGPAEDGLAEDYALLINADIAAPPRSVIPSACSPGFNVSIGVVADPDPAVAAAALRLSLDGSPVRRIPLAPGETSVRLTLAPGSHLIETRAEDSLGQVESQAQRATVLVGAPPVLHIASDQGVTVYPQRARAASVSVTAGDSADPLVLDPTASHQAIWTGRPGRFTVSRVATDGCGNSSTSTFTYTVRPAPRITALRLQRPAPHRRLLITYRDSLRARAGFTLVRLLPSRTPVVARLTHADAPGANGLSLAGLRLAPGRYRLRGSAAVRGAAQGPAASLSFRLGG